MPFIMLELSRSGVKVNRFGAAKLNDQILVSRVLKELEPDLAVLTRAVRQAYRTVTAKKRDA